MTTETLTAFDVVREQIDKELIAEEVIPSEAAHRIINRLRNENPSALTEWLEQQAEQFMRAEIGRLMHAFRSRARANAQAKAFGEAVESGDKERIGLFATLYRVDDTHRQVRLADMVGDDCTYVATSYESAAAASLMHAAFFRALAKKAKGRRVGDVISEAECQRLLASIQP